MPRRNLKILLISIGIVIPLTFLQYRYLSSALIYLLYPGDVLELLITGPHGGSIAEERFAPVLGFFVNVCAYWFVLIFILFAIKAARGRLARE